MPACKAAFNRYGVAPTTPLEVSVCVAVLRRSSDDDHDTLVQKPEEGKRKGGMQRAQMEIVAFTVD